MMFSVHLLLKMGVSSHCSFRLLRNFVSNGGCEEGAMFKHRERDKMMTATQHETQLTVTIGDLGDFRHSVGA
jgi:hypothetical protein